MQSDRAVGVAVLLFSLIALGTWPALLDLSALHGRHPAHAYLDYCSAVLLVAGVLALASGEPLTDAGWVSITLAGGGGVLLMLGNLSMQRALLMGVPLTIVLPLYLISQEMSLMSTSQPALHNFTTDTSE